MKIHKLIALAMLECIAISAHGQQPVKIKYQGDIQAGYSVGIGSMAQDRVNLHFINSARFSDYFSAGLGVGLDLYTNFIYDAPELALPIYLNAKGYVPVNRATSFFLSFDLGASIGLTEGMEGMSGLMLVPAVGARFKTGNNKAVTLSLGYNYQAWSESIISVNTDAITLRLGYSF